MTQYFPLVGLSEDEVQTKIDKHRSKYANTHYNNVNFHAAIIIQFTDYTGLATVKSETQDLYFSLCSIEPNLEQTF